MWYVRPAKPEISSLIRAFACRLKLLAEHHLEALSLKRGCKFSSESTVVKLPHCWKSHVTDHIIVTASEQIHLYSVSSYNIYSRTLVKSA